LFYRSHEDPDRDWGGFAGVAKKQIFTIFWQICLLSSAEFPDILLYKFFYNQVWFGKRLRSGKSSTFNVDDTTQRRLPLEG
jgi:hypothetical protein